MFSGLNANLLEANSIFPDGLSAFVVTGIPAQDESLWQPQGSVFALALCHHHPQEKDQQDDQSCHSEQVEQLGLWWQQGLT